MLARPGYVAKRLNDARIAVRTHDYESAIDHLRYPGPVRRPGRCLSALASMYRVGRGMWIKDLELANEWMLKAANTNHARAQYTMGHLSLSENDSPESREERPCLVRKSGRRRATPWQLSR